VAAEDPIIVSPSDGEESHESEDGGSPNQARGFVTRTEKSTFMIELRDRAARVLVAAQLRMFLDQAGQLWQRGKLVNKVVTAFTSSQTVHGGQESTLLALHSTAYHWGSIVLPLGYTVAEAFNGGGNRYGASYTSGTRVGEPDPETLAVAVAQGQRLARVAQVIGSAQELGLLDIRRGVLEAAPAQD